MLRIDPLKKIEVRREFILKGSDMKKIFAVTVLLLAFAAFAAADVKISVVKGDVQVRRGVSEEWQTVAVGDVLKPEDSIRLGRKSSASIVTDDSRKLTIPEDVIIDVSDLRNLTQEELLLKLAMEDVRSVPEHSRDNDFEVPRTSTIHGANKGSTASVSATAPHPDVDMLELNGVKVLYTNGYYATSVLKAKEIFRLRSPQTDVIETRFMVADALEKMNLNGEAFDEYSDISQEPLTSAQRSLVDKKLADLKAKNR
jgi:hypothetical protein